MLCCMLRAVFVKFRWAVSDPAFVLIAKGVAILDSYVTRRGLDAPQSRPGTTLLGTTTQLLLVHGAGHGFGSHQGFTMEYGYLAQDLKSQGDSLRIFSRKVLKSCP